MTEIDYRSYRLTNTPSQSIATIVLALFLHSGDVAYAKPRTNCFNTCEKHPNSSLEEDPFGWALDRVKESRRGNCHGVLARHYGVPKAGRYGIKRHSGTDLFVPIDTPIQVPAESVFLIGITKMDGSLKKTTGAARSLGNSLVFFVPNRRQPYFLQFAHLSERTFELLDEEDIGRNIVREVNKDMPIAYTGASRSGDCPHLHIAATTTFWFGNSRPDYTTEEFMAMYRESRLIDFLRGKNFYAIVPGTRRNNHWSLEGYLSPEMLIRNRRLRISNKPEGRRVYSGY